MDNSVAQSSSSAYKLQVCGEIMGDPFEVSILRKEDFDHHKGRCEADDVIQGATKPSAQTERGNQGPAAFLIMVSGLSKVNAK